MKETLLFVLIFVIAVIGFRTSESIDRNTEAIGKNYEKCEFVKTNNGDIFATVIPCVYEN